MEDPSESTQLFDPDLMVVNGIISVKVKIAFKYDLESIHQTGEIILFEFDQNGYVKIKTEINPFKDRQDSIITQYFRKKSGKLIMKVKTDPRYTYVEIFEYNNHQLIGHEYYQMNKTRNWNENLYDKNLMWSDSIHYDEGEINVFNRYGKNYRNHRIKRNENDKIIRNSVYDQSGRWLKTISFSYRENILESMEEVNNNRLMFNWKKEFKYNKNGLSDVYYFKNNRLEYKRKLSYNSEGLIEIDLKRNESNKKMTILQFDYSK